MVRDPLSDLVARIKNGYMASLSVVTMPHSKLRESVVNVLSKSGYVKDVKVSDGKLTVGLVYKSKAPAITEIVRVSKPGSRIYCGYKSLPRVLSGLGTLILSSPAGVISGREARKLKVGGEIICKVW
ncbi:MAG: 30S ribosomal protein S8 [Patescibacteria group bacterium]